MKKAVVMLVLAMVIFGFSFLALSEEIIMTPREFLEIAKESTQNFKKKVIKSMEQVKQMAVLCSKSREIEGVESVLGKDIKEIDQLMEEAERELNRVKSLRTKDEQKVAVMVMVEKIIMIREIESAVIDGIEICRRLLEAEIKEKFRGAQLPFFCDTIV